MQPNQASIPNQAPPDRATQDALLLLKELEEQKIQVEQSNDEADSKEWQYFHQCRRGHPALFYTKNPRGGSVSPKGWFSSYKKPGEPWRGYVVCQLCTKFHADGEMDLDTETPIQVNSFEGSNRQTTVFVPNPRYVYRYPKDKAKRREIPAHRTAMLPHSSANYGVPNPNFHRSIREKSDMEAAAERQKREQLLQELNRG